jgi:hypothetical protein
MRALANCLLQLAASGNVLLDERREFGADVDNLDEVVTDVAVEADEGPVRAVAMSGDAGEARRLPLGIFRTRAHQHPVEATSVQLCDVGHGNQIPGDHRVDAMRHYGHVHDSKIARSGRRTTLGRAQAHRLSARGIVRTAPIQRLECFQNFIDMDRRL